MRMQSRGLLSAVALVALVAAWPTGAGATTITTFYGDDDGFGVGATSGTINENESHAEPGEAPGTDTRLIGIGFIAPPFAPAGGFDPFFLPPGETIASVRLTMRMGGFDSGPNPVDAPDGFPNEIYLDGRLVDPAFIGGFTTAPGILGQGLIEERSILLPASFFDIFTDGSVSLARTHLSEDSGSGSFQIDFLRLDITTAAVPEPSSLLLLGLGAVGMGLFARSRRL